jgi:hypothetical protein
VVRLYRTYRLCCVYVCDWVVVDGGGEAVVVLGCDVRVNNV